jgi:type II secretory pathway pseudopilin PulG
LKSGKPTYLLVILGVVAAIFAGLWVMRSQQAQEQERLYEELSVAVAKLDNVNSDELLSQQAELERQISQTLSQLETAQATVAQSAESISVSGTLFDIAELAGVEVIAISSSPPSGNKWQEIPCIVLPLTVTIEGDVPSLLSFISKLDRALTTAVIRSAVITIPEATDGEESSAESQLPSANVQLGIYSYQGE